MTELQRRFDAYLQEYHPSLAYRLDGSTHDPRWLMAKSERDILWNAFKAGARNASL